MDSFTRIQRRSDVGASLVNSNVHACSGHELPIDGQIQWTFRSNRCVDPNHDPHKLVCALVHIPIQGVVSLGQIASAGISHFDLNIDILDGLHCGCKVSVKTY